jgi:hypothetical protein
VNSDGSSRLEMTQLGHGEEKKVPRRNGAESSNEELTIKCYKRRAVVAIDLILVNTRIRVGCRLAA